MKVIDLFAGVGGLSHGFKEQGFSIVYANEYNKSIASAYELNNPETTVDTTDIRDIDIQEFFSKYSGTVSVVMGGPPCQGFSQKGKRFGLNDERNFMFRKFAEVVEVVQPEFFIIENVPNMLSAEGGYFKNEIYKLFSEIGYSVTSKVLRAEEFGIPQKRRRAIVLGSKSYGHLSIPETNGDKTTVAQALSDLPKLKSGEGAIRQEYIKKPQNKFQRKMRKGNRFVFNHIATKHSDLALERLKYVTLDSTKSDLPAEHQTKSVHSGTWTRLKPDGFARTITTRFDTPSSGQFTLPYQDRCITVREAARLQSFPDYYIFSGTKSSQMLQVGNAVPPILGEVLAKYINKLTSDPNGNQ